MDREQARLEWTWGRRNGAMGHWRGLSKRPPLRSSARSMGREVSEIVRRPLFVSPPISAHARRSTIGS